MISSPSGTEEVAGRGPAQPSVAIHDPVFDDLSPERMEVVVRLAKTKELLSKHYEIVAEERALPEMSAVRRCRPHVSRGPHKPKAQWGS